MADDRKVAFNWYLNRQGPRGPQGVKGDTGFSPNISVETDTLNEYILRITNEGGYFLTSNLREHKEDRGGTYIRYDRENGIMYAGEADTATDAKAGMIKIASVEDVEAEDESSAVTPAILVDYIAGVGGAPIDDTTVSSSKVWSSEKTSQSIAAVSNQVATNTTDISNIKTALPNKQNKLTAGANITIEGDIISATGSGSGDVTLAGNNYFTGDNIFTGTTKFDDDVNIHGANLEVTGGLNANSATITNLQVPYTLTSSGQINAIIIKTAGIVNNQNGKHYLTQASIAAGDNVSIEETTEGVKISATGGGGTSLNAVQPLKLVDDTLTLQIDEQTLQVQNGKLVANLDELGNEVNTLAGEVMSVQANLLKKQDGLVPASPIEIKKSTGLTVVGSPISGNDFVMDSISTTSYCLFPENYLAIGNEYQIKFTTPNSWPSAYISIVDFYDPLGPQYDYETGNISVWTNRDGAGFEPVIPSPALNTTYYIRMKMTTSTRIETCYSTDGKTFTRWKATDINANLPWSAQRHHVGVGYDPRTNEVVRVWTGTIDLKECYVIADGVKYYMFPDAKTGAIGINLGSGLTVTDGKLTATGSSAPKNMVTTDTAQTITGQKSFVGGLVGTGYVIFRDQNSSSQRFEPQWWNDGVELAIFNKNNEKLSFGVDTTNAWFRPFHKCSNFYINNYSDNSAENGIAENIVLSGRIKNKLNDITSNVLTQKNITNGDNITVTETADGIQVAGLSNSAIVDLSSMTGNSTIYTNVVSGTEYTIPEAGFFVAKGETTAQGYITIDIKDQQGDWIPAAGINAPTSDWFILTPALFIAAGEVIRVRHGNAGSVVLRSYKTKGGTQ